MKKYINYILVIILSFIYILNVNAETGYVSDKSGVNMRDNPNTSNSNVLVEIPYKTEFYISKMDVPKGNGCSNYWYYVYYNNNYGYVCSNLVKIVGAQETSYNRPWTSPKKAIIGGAEFISSSYIEKGQFTSYLKKFNVNPESEYKVYNHQYMANLKAPYSEAYTSYKSYKENNFLSYPLEFTIPIYENMPEYTVLPGNEYSNECKNEITDSDFETLLNQEGFPESYKCKLRSIHDEYPNWIFKTMKTNLDFNKSVIAEQNVSSIQGGDIYYDLSSGSRVQTEKNWYRANYETVAYYLDPRNFLNPERIIMFENVGYSENYTEQLVVSMLKGTFMEGISLVDNQTYSSIFIEAGEKAKISPVYLVSLAIQESSTKLTNTTSGAEFSYEGVTYKGLYNFFNIGAYSSASNPALAGLVWASGGFTDVIVNNQNNTVTLPNEGEAESPEVMVNPFNEELILTRLNAKLNNNCLVGLNLGTTIQEIKDKFSEYTIVTDETSILKTGQVIKISDGKNEFSYQAVISGDVDGDGSIGATDYVKIKNYIMEKENSGLDIPQGIAADYDENNEIGATDYVKIKNSIMEG